MDGQYAEALEQALALNRWLHSGACIGQLIEAYGLPVGAGYAAGIPARLERSHQDESTRMVEVALTMVRAVPMWSLENAAPYFWATSLVELLGTGAASAPPIAMMPELLPTPAGFLWLGAPLVAPEMPILRALLWSAVAEPPPGASHPQGWVTLTPIFGGHRIRQAGIPGPSLTLPFHQRLSWDETYVSASFRGWTPSVAVAALRVFVAALLFMADRIVVDRPTPVPRASRRRAERGGWSHEPMVRVVELRRRSTGAVWDAADEARAWTCRWLVRGHWRQQACGRERAERRPRWILPYVKGPADKPLKPPSTRIFAVVR